VRRFGQLAANLPDRLCDRAGIDAERRCCVDAARMISADASDKALQSILGHSSASFTRTVYGHLFDADLDALADRLDSMPRTSRGLRVAETAGRSTDMPSDQDEESGPGWDRTSDRRIMSPLL
jgi:hypothetical protein